MRPPPHPTLQRGDRGKRDAGGKSRALPRFSPLVVFYAFHRPAASSMDQTFLEYPLFSRTCRCFNGGWRCATPRKDIAEREKEPERKCVFPARSRRIQCAPRRFHRREADALKRFNLPALVSSFSRCIRAVSRSFFFFRNRRLPRNNSRTGVFSSTFVNYVSELFVRR